MNPTAAYWIAKLHLQPHPEGGYFREIYRSDEVIAQSALPSRFKGDRSFSTSIYFLLENEQFSAFHRINSEEIWHFYKGNSITLYIISEEGNLSTVVLGDDIDKGETLQVIIPRNCWFAAGLNQQNTFCLVGCTVAPGFDFHDFELGEYKKLKENYPQHNSLLESFCINVK
jgi:uncharacterized protein